MKKPLSLVLSCVMVFSLCVPAFATDSLEDRIENEIEARKAEVFAEIRCQLEAQNALSHMFIYEEILTPEIEASVLAKYGISKRDARYSAPYGGVVQYSTSTYDVVITYLDYDNSYYYILNDVTTISAQDVMIEILGYIPVVGGIFSAIITIASALDSIAKRSIADCDGFLKIMDVYYTENGTTSSSVTGWETHTTMIVPTGATNVYANLFPQHNPWE